MGAALASSHERHAFRSQLTPRLAPSAGPNACRTDAAPRGGADQGLEAEAPGRENVHEVRARTHFTYALALARVFAITVSVCGSDGEASLSDLNW